MGQNLLICKKCKKPDSDIEFNNNQEHENCDFCETYKNLNYEQLIEKLEKLNIYNKRIASKTLILPSKDKILIDYLKRFKMYKKGEEIHSKIMFNKFCDSIDYILENTDEKKAEFKKRLTFIQDCLY